MENKGDLLMASSDSFFQVSRRAMLSAFATLPALSVPLPGSALAQLPASPTGQAPVTDPLPSWNDTGPKKAIFEFVERVTMQGSADFVPPPERIATFDNDGTLWAEQPMYFQLALRSFHQQIFRSSIAAASLKLLVLLPQPADELRGIFRRTVAAISLKLRVDGSRRHLQHRFFAAFLLRPH
jgi:hypothetical protein